MRKASPPPECMAFIMDAKAWLLRQWQIEHREKDAKKPDDTAQKQKVSMFVADIDEFVDVFNGQWWIKGKLIHYAGAAHEKELKQKQNKQKKLRRRCRDHSCV